MSYRHVIEEIKKNKVFLISTHVNVDADALAGELALAQWLRAMKKKVHIVNAQDMPKMFSFFPGVKSIERFKKQNISYDVAIILDCGSLSRIAQVRELLAKDKKIINIDHHITNNYFGHPNCVYPKASSTAEIIFDLLQHARFPLNKTIARLLYLGIMTDTGSFRYDSTSSRTHEIISQLLKFDIPIYQMYRKSYEDIPLRDMKEFASMIKDFEIHVKDRVITFDLTRAKSRRFTQSFDLRDRIFTFLRAIKGVEVVVIFTEVSKKQTRVNFRSQEKVDVARLAHDFEGGGHKRASGCRINEDLKTAKQIILKQLHRTLT
ncbi:MAG: bifunctional oligoribonuclease/PAP phosphatase NrnA [Candidatus Omnitrophota bacterium]